MTEGTVRFEERGRVGHVTFDRPSARNALTWAMYAELADICRRIAAERKVGVVVFRGAGGKAFVAGTDIAHFVDFASGEDGIRYEAEMDAFLATLEALPMPTIAVVEGFAVGGGLAIATACDFRIATPDARFGVPIARTLGNCLSAKGYARLLAAIGVSHAKRLLILGEMIDATEAKAAGYVHAIAEPGAIGAAADALCARLLENAPITMEASKEALRRVVAANLPDIEGLVRRVYGSEDFRRGVRAFLDKKPPEWTGR
ncbi:MAG: enoyl-CoA hydratase/isomerase family protein [Propylenella sp.]